MRALICWYSGLNVGEAPAAEVPVPAPGALLLVRWEIAEFITPHFTIKAPCRPAKSDK
jgi:hypothetical protein